MIATLMKLEKRPSRYGGHFFYAFFKTSDGQSVYTCLYERMRNYKRWKKVLKVGTVFSKLRLVKGKKNLVDADSKFQIVEE